MTYLSDYAFRMTHSLRFGHLLPFNTDPLTPPIPSSTVSILITCILITAIPLHPPNFRNVVLVSAFARPPALLLPWIASCSIMYHQAPFRPYPATLDGHCTFPGREGENEMKK